MPPIQRFARKLRDYGYVEGQNLRLVSRFAEGREERYPVMTGNGDLHECEVARNGRDVAQILDLQNIDQLEQVRSDPIDAHLVAVDDDGHPRDASDIGPSDGQ